MLTLKGGTSAVLSDLYYLFLKMKGVTSMSISLNSL